MITNQYQNNIYKSRINHKYKKNVVENRLSKQIENKPSTQRDEQNISFKGGFSLTSLKKAFAPHIKKTHNLSENIGLLKKYIGKAPEVLSNKTQTWEEIHTYLKHSTDGKSIEIVEKNWPTLLLEGIIYPFKELPLHIGDWAKNLFKPKAKQEAEGIFKTLNNTDIVNAMSGYMESAAKLKHDAEAVQSANLFTKAMKTFDPKTGNYNGVHERALTRIVTGFIPAFFLANDAYNLSRLCDDDPKEAEKEKKLRFNQEVKRVMSNAYLQLITLGALSKYINKNTGVFVGVTAITVFITEALSRLSNGKKIHFISEKEAKEINKKEAEKNPETATNKPQYKNVNDNFKAAKPGFKGTKVFNDFGFASEMPLATMKIATFSEKTTNNENKKELKPLLSLSVLTKWFIGTIALGLAVKHGKNIKIGKNGIKIADYMNVISKKYDSIYNKLTQHDFKIKNTEFKAIIEKLRKYDPVIANKVEKITNNYQRISSIKKEALNIAATLRKHGLDDLATAFEHLNNQKLNKTFKDIPAFKAAESYFKNLDNEVITKNLNELFEKLKNLGLEDKANELKNIIFKDEKVNTENYKQALKFVKQNLKEYTTTFENRFKVDTTTETQKLFDTAMSKLSEINSEIASNITNKIENSINEEYISLGKQNTKGVRELADFVTEPFKFMWGTITLPYKHIAKKALDLTKVDIPKWDKEFDAATNLIKKLRAKSMFGFGNKSLLTETDEAFAKYMNTQISKSFNTATMSSVSNSDLSALAKNTSTAATIWFLMADNHNMVMLKSNGDDKKNATLKAKERLVQETSRTFYNVMFINLFNNTFRSLFNSSLIGAQIVNTMSTLVGENINRKAIGVPVGTKTRDEILEADKRHLEDNGIKGDFFRFMSRLTGKKALTQRETSKK